MTQQELTMEAAKLRLRVRMNNRLKLESQALLSRLFREHEVPVRDELLSYLVFAVPDELLAEAEAAAPSETIKIPPSNPPTKRTERPKEPPKPPPNPPTKRHNGGHIHKPPPKPPTKR